MTSTSGDGLLVGAIFGVATGAAVSGDPIEAALVGVFDLTKAGCTGVGGRRQDLLGRYRQRGDQDGNEQYADRRRNRRRRQRCRRDGRARASQRQLLRLGEVRIQLLAA